MLKVACSIADLEGGLDIFMDHDLAANQYPTLELGSQFK
jgi:hypothetical protein